MCGAETGLAEQSKAFTHTEAELNSHNKGHQQGRHVPAAQSCLQ